MKKNGVVNRVMNEGNRWDQNVEANLVDGQSGRINEKNEENERGKG